MAKSTVKTHPENEEAIVDVAVEEINPAEVKFISFEDLQANFEEKRWDFCEPDIYIRNLEDITEEQKNKELELKIDALYFGDPTNLLDQAENKNGTGYFKIQDAITIYHSSVTNKKHLLNGNTRIKALLKAVKDEKYLGVRVFPIPYKEETDTSEDNLSQLQIRSNDTTNPHNILDIAKKAYEYKEKRVKFWETNGLSRQESKSRSTTDVKARFGIRSDGYLTQLKTIYNLPNWAKELIRNDVISADSARKVEDSVKKHSKEFPSLTLDTVFAQLEAAMHFQNRSLITPSDVEQYFKKLVDQKTPPGVNNYDSIESLVVDNKISSSAAEVSTNYLEDINQDTKAIKEPVFVSKLLKCLSDEHTIIEEDDVKQIINSLIPKEVSVDEFRTNVDRFCALFNKVLEQDVSSNSINNLSNELFKDVSKFIHWTAKYFDGSYSKQIFEPNTTIIMVICSRVADIETALGKKIEDSAVVTPLIKMISDMIVKLEDILKELKKPSVVDKFSKPASPVGAVTLENVTPLEIIKVDDENGEAWLESDETEDEMDEDEMDEV